MLRNNTSLDILSARYDNYSIGAVQVVLNWLTTPLDFDESRIGDKMLSNDATLQFKHTSQLAVNSVG